MDSRATVTCTRPASRSARDVLKCGTAAALVVLSMSGCADTTANADAPAAAPGPSTSDVVPSVDLCRFLKTELPLLKSAGSEVGARSQFATDVFTLYQHYRGAIPDGNRIDAQTKQNCPDLRAQVLEVTGSDNFAEI
jgi:hypothetical protein